MERKIVLLTDSTCDLTDQMLKENGIDMICFKIALDGEGYTERVDFTPEQFCQMMRDAKDIPKTAQIPAMEFLERFEEYDAAGKSGVIYASINAGGSGTNAAAHQAAELFHERHPESGMRIEIVDSRAYSVAEGAPVIWAAKKIDAGMSFDEAVAFLKNQYARMEILLVAYTLKTIRKSGRISAAAAITGELLGIHPIFTLNDGVSKVVKKVRGDRGVVSSMVNLMKERQIEGKPYFIMASDKKYIPEYEKACTEAIGYPPAGTGILGAAVLSNTGSEAVGLVYEGAFRERN